MKFKQSIAWKDKYKKSSSLLFKDDDDDDDDGGGSYNIQDAHKLVRVLRQWCVVSVVLCVVEEIPQCGHNNISLEQQPPITQLSLSFV